MELKLLFFVVSVTTARQIPGVEFETESQIIFPGQTEYVNNNDDKTHHHHCETSHGDGDEKPDKVIVVNINTRGDHNRSNDDDKKTPEDNEVTPVIDDNVRVQPLDDKWTWSDTSTIKTTTTTTTTARITTKTNATDSDLDNRAAFDGAQCPQGQIRPKGFTMCVDKD